MNRYPYILDHFNIIIYLLSLAETYLLVVSGILYIMSICLVVLLCSSNTAFKLINYKAFTVM